MNSGSWWWTGRPGVLRFMGSQGVGHNWVTELNWCLSRRKFGIMYALGNLLREYMQYQKFIWVEHKYSRICQNCNTGRPHFHDLDACASLLSWFSGLNNSSLPTKDSNVCYHSILTVCNFMKKKFCCELFSPKVIMSKQLWQSCHFFQSLHICYLVYTQT